MNILHLSCSPRGDAAESNRLSRTIVERLLQSNPTAVLTNRSLRDGTISHIDANYADAQYPDAAEVAPHGTLARSEQLIRELETAEIVVIGTPMHNWTVPSALKAWMDHVVRAHRTFKGTARGKVGALRDRPVFIAVTSGARFSGGDAHQPDFLTPYLKYALGTIGLHDLTFFSVEGTAAGSSAVTAARAKADRAIRDHVASCFPVQPAPHRYLPC